MYMKKKFFKNYIANCINYDFQKYNAQKFLTDLKNIVLVLWNLSFCEEAQHLLFFLHRNIILKNNHSSILIPNP